MTKLQAALLLGSIQEVLGNDVLTDEQINNINRCMDEMYDHRPDDLTNEMTDMIPGLLEIIEGEDE